LCVGVATLRSVAGASGNVVTVRRAERRRILATVVLDPLGGTRKLPERRSTPHVRNAAARPGARGEHRGEAQVWVSDHEFTAA
jgi:hypothetical protein